MRGNIIAIIPVLDRYPEETINSLNSQTLKPKRIVVAAGTIRVHKECKERGIESVLVNPNFDEHVGIRMTKAMNAALESLNIRLEEYDYILKVDDDVILPPKFLELCVLEDADCVGGSGCAELFKTETFIELFGGSFPKVVSEDTFREFSVLARNKKFSKWPIKPIPIGLKKRHNWRYYYQIGFDRYKLGYDPIHIMLHLRHGKMYLFYVIGYLISLLRREERYHFAPKIFRLKLRELPSQIKSFMKKRLDFQ
ncbi:MAG: glycosyltransferase family A protein [Candidatus Methanomethyliaceae archaeon]